MALRFITETWLLRRSFFLLALIVLAGCAAVSSTQIVRNEHVSKEIKGTVYREVLLIRPKSDPRNVVPRVIAGFEGMGFQVRLMDPEKPLDAAQGTGFLIGSDGFVVTCAHVLSDEKKATITLDGKRYLADVVKADEDADLALLKLREAPPASVNVLSFRSTARGYSMGEDVFTIGYPMSRILGKSARMTKGVVSATSGMHDDPKQIQISAEVQPGNSGGPVLDHDGQVVGVIQQTINPWRVAISTGGALPQNVNFSLKNAAVLEFLKGASAPTFEQVRFDQGGGLEAAAHGVARVQAGIAADDADQRGRLVVGLSYQSTWNIGPRLPLFVLKAADFDTLEPLFVAYNKGMGDEDEVIKDTIAQFRKTIESF